MKKKAYTLVELIIYAFILSFIAVYLVILARKFYDNAQNNLLVHKFANNYNGLIKNIHTKSLDGWMFSGNVASGVVLYNSGNYLAYSCLDEAIGISFISTGFSSIQWDQNQNLYTGFDCNYISGWLNNSGYWLEFDIKLLDKSLNYKYYLYPQ